MLWENKTKQNKKKNNCSQTPGFWNHFKNLLSEVNRTSVFWPYSLLYSVKLKSLGAGLLALLNKVELALNIRQNRFHNINVSITCKFKKK